MTRLLHALGALGVLVASPASAETIYVDAALTTGANDGTSWADAYQGAGGLDVALGAREAVDVIWVTGGRYVPGVRFREGKPTFYLEGGVTLLGGFAGGESSPGERPARGLAPTILDGDLGRDDLLPGGTQGDNCRHVVSMDGATGRMDRVTIERGYAWGSGFYGGGVEDFGAGISTIEFRDCTFRNNGAQFAGGGVSCNSINGRCRFIGCLFEDNRVGSFGGGLFLERTREVVVERCEFRRNSAGAGGGLALRSNSSARVTDSLFVDNESRGAFGGGALFIYVAGSVELNSSTLFGNRALTANVGGASKGAGELVVTNCILWANTGAGGTAAANQLDLQAGVTNSHVQGWTFGGVGNSSADPMLTDPLGGDFEPLPGSPVIDAGGDESPFLLREGDFLGRRRRVDDPQTPNTGSGTGEVLDIGAVERSVGAIGTMFCTGDLNGSGQRGMIDAFGSPTASDNSLVLVASQLPVGVFGIFIVSRNLRPSIPPNGLTLCLGGPDIGRFVGPGQVLGTGAAGQFSLALDLSAIPTGSGFVPVLPGQSWSFECWHRDSQGLGGFRFTDATTVLFE